MTFQKGRFNICSIFLDTFRKVRILKRKESLLKKKTKEKKANKELIKMFDDKIKLSV